MSAKTKIDEAINSQIASARSQILDSLWDLEDDFFNELFDEMVVTISPFSKKGGMAIFIRSCDDHDLEREFSMSDILENSNDYITGNTDWKEYGPELELLAKSFEGLAKKCRDRLQEIGIKPE